MRTHAPRITAMQTYLTLFKFRHPATGVIHTKGDTITGPDNWETIHAGRLSVVGETPAPVEQPPVDPVTGGEPVKEGEGYRAYTEPTTPIEPVTPRRKRKAVEKPQPTHHP